MAFQFEYIRYIGFALLALFGISVIIQLLYYLGYYLRIATYKRAPQLKKYPVSVIICARNEAENLKNNLPSILNQRHDKFEVIVVNDCSTDDTDEVLGQLLKKHKNLKVTSISPDKKFTHGKKLAVTLGIKAATHEWLVFTDADCYAESEHWLERIQENYTDKKEIVIGYGGYKSLPGLLNKYIRYDTLMIAMQYFGLALAGKPYMGVGRNLSYRKSLFFRNKGFASHYGLLSGDDDLFVNETATPENVAAEFHMESHTRSVPKLSLNQWFTQKKRHFTTAGKYKPIHFFIIGLEPFSRFLFYLTIVLLLSLNIYSPYVLAVGSLRLMVLLIVCKLSMRRLNEHNLLLWIVIFDAISLFINFILYLSIGFRSKRSRWK